MIDLDNGELEPTRVRLERLLGAIAPHVAEVKGSPHLDHAHRMIEVNGTDRQREIAAERGPRALTRALADAFLEGLG